MSEHISHIAICLDVRNLCRVLGEGHGIEPVFNDVWNDPANDAMAQLGGVTRRADFWSTDIVTQAKAAHDGERDDPNWPQKLAFILGALTHRSIDRMMKPVFQHFKNDADFPGFNECTIYCDVHMLRRRFDDGSLFPPDMLDPTKRVGSDHLDLLMRETLRRELVRIHTLNPDDAHIDDWFNGLIKAVQEFKIRLHEYERAFTTPDLAKHQRYIEDTNYYDESAPLIKLTRTLASHGTATADEVAAALAATDNTHGRYARAVKRAVEYIQTAAKLWRGDLTADQAKPKFDIGQAELAITYPEPGEKHP
jgi:hypothetical protein